ncbi:MAG: hypothetical protein KF865_11285 [Bdellovibrionaceae bacterium]|nr:hypothetical protein [Pseudobdellovibrionaceae bacterium]
MVRALFLILFLAPSLASAKVHFGVSYGANNDSNSLDSKNVTSTTYFNGYVFVQLVEKYRIYLGAEYAYLSASGPNADSTLSQMQASGPLVGVKWLIGRDDLFFMSVAGTTLTQATYKVSGAQTETWTGYSYAGQVGLRPLITTRLRLTAGLTYIASTYTTKSVSSTGTPSSSKSNFVRTYYSPTVGLELDF